MDKTKTEGCFVVAAATVVVVVGGGGGGGGGVCLFVCLLFNISFYWCSLLIYVAGMIIVKISLISFM